ncbi:lantibiotic protection ABC transporter ATP-binding subunit [Schaedlerella arabinosiphila]|uniref:Lantibiotic protection ABC transporter ATP-binding subunit n=1 Tax=Schaedlerella arabinosiphila TaxID=2044587 RepID=A0A3R8KRU6_9FIRM|nr:lantibiotic protection ABC transporter ATP-binding protein [Schaedlerella arabinosiphila]RRK30364.1 lantibiotic protection ABC transporter ATP-binding subunit [Schaedlerella arabinosiphila]
MMKHILETECVTKEFRGHSAVCGVSLQIPECCVYGLLGPNGAGKSTILKMLTGILRPTSGKVLFDGHSWSRKDLAEIGALVETPPVYENLTAWENLKVRALILGISDARIREVLDLVDLADTGKKKAGAFSLGMKQRLGLGIALLGRPKLLILDEPLNGLDPIGIQELREMIRRFPQEGITVIVSSHILSEIAQTADYIGIIANGMLGYQGEMPEEGHLEELFMKIAAKHRAA